MTTPVFENNSKTTLSAGITDSATTIPVVDASVFSARIQDGAGSTDELHQLATLDDGANIEIVKVTNANTTTDELTVVREQEGTTKFAFSSGDDIEGRLTAEIMNGGFFGREFDSYMGNLGANAVDLVTLRTSADHAASADYSVAMGHTNGVKGSSGGVAIGYNNLVSANYGVALGASCEAIGVTDIAIGTTAVTSGGGSAMISIGISSTVSAGQGLALGNAASATAAGASAIGSNAIARIAETNVISGMNIVRNSGEYSAAEIVAFSALASFTTIIDNKVEITIPTGSTFFVTEVGVIPTELTSVTGQPTIEFGSGATGQDAILTATAVTTATVRKRERYLSDAGTWVADADNVGHTTMLTMSITTAAVATTFNGRVYFRGILVEDE